ncbi:MAG: glycosyltransferase family 4 protein [Verrucomicrobia bacterium]|nr:glycosyltransferase family 4 protein [Verrucomicrobiota bacterium]
MLLLSHPTGNEFVRHAARAFNDANVLGEFHTGVSWNPHSAVNAFLPRRLRAELGRRSFAPELRPHIHNHPWREAGRLAGQALGIRALIHHESGPCSVDAVFRDLDRRVARRLRHVGGFTGLYAYEDGAEFSFRAAQAAGLKCFYDLPIGYWRAARDLFREESEREPEWACTLTGNLDSNAKLERKDEELRLASVVVVASSFTRRTLERMTDLRAPIVVVPYGAPPVDTMKVKEPNLKGPLRVMFAGSLTQRKGVSYFLKACELMKSAVEVTIVGRKSTDECRPLEDALNRHRYIASVPHAEMLAEMARQDVLVFPSLFEGFGLVILEAMAQGVPVITTSHTAGPEVITEGEDGFLVPIRDAQAIAEKLELLAADRRRLWDMAEAARRKAAKLGWEHYRRGLVAAVQPESSAVRPAAVAV